MAMFSATDRFGNSDRSWKMTCTPSALAIGRIEALAHLARDLDPSAGIGRMHAGDQLDQGGLAAAVLTDEAVHLARKHVPIDPVERQQHRRIAC